MTDARAALLARMSEAQLVANVFDTTDKLGLLAFHDPDLRACERCGHVQRDRRRRGFPDLWIPAPPVLYVREAKTMRGRVELDQHGWLRDIEACETINVGVLRPDGLHAFQGLLAGEREVLT
jgi:hypothetical protein